MHLCNASTFLYIKPSNKLKRAKAIQMQRVCKKGCGVKGYEGSRDPWNLLDNGYFGLVGCTKVQANFFSSPMREQMRYSSSCLFTHYKHVLGLPFNRWKQVVSDTLIFPLKISMY